MFPEKSFEDIKLEKTSKAEELSSKLSFNDVDDKLMHSVVENDEETIDDGKLISQSINQGFSSFIPDMSFDQLNKDYSVAKNIFGEKLIRLISGYDPNFIKKNINIPEFKRELKYQIEKKFEDMKRRGLVEKDGSFTNKSIELASLVMYTTELDNIIPKGNFGERVNTKNYLYGDKENNRNYKKGDMYNDIDIRKSIRKSLIRNHKSILPEDLVIFERKSRGKISIVYSIDASGSMKGKKIEAAKKAGIALSFKAIENRDDVGLIVFKKLINAKVDPTDNFGTLLKTITSISASGETNMTKTIEESLHMFPDEDITKHLIIISDALPTIGKDPQKEVLEIVAQARAMGITISVIGISIEEDAADFAKKIAEVGEGRLYVLNDLDNINKIILEDYDAVVSEGT